MISKTRKGLQIAIRTATGILTVFASLSFAQPSYANTQFTSLDQQLTVEYGNECSTTTPSGTYRVQNGVSGNLTATNCSDLGGDQGVHRFADTTGTYRCYGTMTQEWGRSVITIWDIEGAVSAYSCLDIGERYTVEMDSGRSF